MDNFNKVISFILGLVVVIVFFAVITGRLNLRGRIPLLTRSVSPTQSVKTTPTPISTIRISPASVIGNQTYNRYQKTPTTIPATGSPTIILTVLISSLMTGFYLRRK